jgi:spermidine synthase
VAIIWQKKLKGTRYEIRKAGNSIRLYTDGVFHSQYNPDHPITRSVWDLLMLPAFFYDNASIKRVLVLGVGGGSVLQLLHKFIQPEEMIGIELNPVHIQIAKRFFGINKKIATLYADDAIRWMEKYQGPPFDMIIDDLFGEVDGEGVRPIPLNSKWLGLLNRHTTKQGLIVANTVDTKTLKQCAYFDNQRIHRSFKSVFRMSIPQLENIVAVFLKQPSSSKQLRQNIFAIEGLNKQSGPNRLNVRITDITI